MDYVGALFGGNGSRPLARLTLTEPPEVIRPPRDDSFGKRTAEGTASAMANDADLKDFHNLLELLQVDKFEVTSKREPRPIRGQALEAVTEEYCHFCKRNGETDSVFRSHPLKKNGVVVCPILRKVKCDLCGEDGDNAHTRTHCPTVSRSSGRGARGGLPIALAVRRTPRSATGLLRFSRR